MVAKASSGRTKRAQNARTKQRREDEAMVEILRDREKPKKEQLGVRKISLQLGFNPSTMFN